MNPYSEGRELYSEYRAHAGFCAPNSKVLCREAHLRLFLPLFGTLVEGFFSNAKDKYLMLC